MSKRQTIYCVVSLAIMIAGVTGCCGPGRHSLAGHWSDTREEPLGMFLDLRRDRTFAMGDIDKGERFAGLFGTWETKDDHLILKITKTESCKVQIGQILDWPFTLTSDTWLVLKSPDGNSQRTLTRTAQPTDAPDPLSADR